MSFRLSSIPACKRIAVKFFAFSCFELLEIATAAKITMAVMAIFFMSNKSKNPWIINPHCLYLF